MQDTPRYPDYAAIEARILAYMEDSGTIMPRSWTEASTLRHPGRYWQVWRTPATEESAKMWRDVYRAAMPAVAAFWARQRRVRRVDMIMGSMTALATTLYRCPYVDVGRLRPEIMGVWQNQVIYSKPEPWQEFMARRLYFGGTPKRRFEWMDGYAGIPYTFGR